MSGPAMPDGLSRKKINLALQGGGAYGAFTWGVLDHMLEDGRIEIEGITDPHGFAQDKSVWPGPFCIPKPANGVFKSWVSDDSVNVVGDLFTIGWQTYFWNPKVGRFDGILTTD